MKFLCLRCDAVMTLSERQLPGDGTLAAVFTCGTCGHEMAMLTNPMETQLVSSLGVKIGGRTVPAQPMEITRSGLGGAREDAFETAENRSREPMQWDAEAVERLGRVPGFVRGMVKRIYMDYARERGIAVITPAVMDRARSDLGLEGM
jgi:hypothetical protein